MSGGITHFSAFWRSHNFVITAALAIWLHIVGAVFSSAGCVYIITLCVTKVFSSFGSLLVYQCTVAVFRIWEGVKLCAIAVKTIPRNLSSAALECCAIMVKGSVRNRRILLNIRACRHRGGEKEGSSSSTSSASSSASSASSSSSSAYPGPTQPA